MSHPADPSVPFALDFDDSHGARCNLAQGAGTYPSLFLSHGASMVILDPGLAEWMGDWLREWAGRYPDVAPRPRHEPHPALADWPDPQAADAELRAFLAQWITRHRLTEAQARWHWERASGAVKHLGHE